MMRDEKQTLILDAARKRMMHYGIQKTSMQEIAKEAGLAVGTIYLHFRNKEDIVLALADEYRKEQALLAQETLKSDLPPEIKLKTYLLKRFQFSCSFREDSLHGKEFVRTLLRLEPERVEEWRQNTIGVLAEILKDGKQQGVLRITEPKREAKLLFLATESFFPLPYLELPRWPKEEDLKELLDWLVHRWKQVD